MYLWRFSKSENVKRSPQRRTRINPYEIQRTSFYTCQKGSYTLEVAIIVPLMASYLVMLLFFFVLLEIQCEVDDAIMYAGRKTAVESCIIDSEEALFLSAEAYFLYALQETPLIERYVKYGSWGISLWTSEISKEDIILRAEYIVELPFPFFGINEISLSSANQFRKWVGDQILEDGTYVYVTPYGQVYHKDLTCRSINLSVKKTTIKEIYFLRGKNGQKYYECGNCQWKDSGKEKVYYTDYGTLYHKDIGCSAIKRTIEKIKIEDIGEKRPCSFCYES